MIKLIGIDLDGTFLDDNKNISRENIKAVKNAIDKGVMVIPATGRQFSGIPDEFKNIDGVNYAITANGAGIWGLNPVKAIYTDYFNVDNAKEIINYLYKFNSLISVFYGEETYCEAETLALFEKHLDKTVYSYLKSSRTTVDNLDAKLNSISWKVEKISVSFADLLQREEAIEYFAKNKNINLSSSLSNNLEINTTNASKGNALAFVAKQLGLNQKQVMAIGDSLNDLSMIKSAGLSIAMGNAEEEIKQTADYITKDCNSSGVAHAINKFVL